MIEYYSGYNGRCIVPETSPAQEGIKIVLQKICEGEEFLFCYGYDERIYHAQTNLCLVKVGIEMHFLVQYFHDYFHFSIILANIFLVI